MRMSVPVSFGSSYLFLPTVQNVKAFVDVGDNGNSTYWSSSVATPQNRSIFAANIARFAYVHNLDGIVLEYV